MPPIGLSRLTAHESPRIYEALRYCLTSHTDLNPEDRVHNQLLPCPFQVFLFPGSLRIFEDLEEIRCSKPAPFWCNERLLENLCELIASIL